MDAARASAAAARAAVAAAGAAGRSLVLAAASAFRRILRGGAVVTASGASAGAASIRSSGRAAQGIGHRARRGPPAAARAVSARVPRPRLSKRTSAVALGVFGVTALAAVAISLGADEPARTELRSAQLRFAVPVAWQSEAVPHLGGLSLAGAVAASDSGHAGHQLVAGLARSRAQVARLVHDARTTAGAPASTRLGAIQAWTWKGVQVAGAPARLYVGYTSSGPLVAICRGGTGGRTCSAFEHSTLTLTGPRPTRGLDRRSGAKLRLAMATLHTRGSSGRERWPARPSHPTRPAEARALEGTSRQRRARSLGISTPPASPTRRRWCRRSVGTRTVQRPSRRRSRADDRTVRRRRAPASCQRSAGRPGDRAGLDPLAGLEHAHTVALDLAHAPVVGQQVHVAEHLGQRQVRLRDRDVAPQLLRDLVRGARAGLDQPVDLLGPPAVQREALVDQLAVVCDRVAVARAARAPRPSRGSARASAGRSRAPAGARSIRPGSRVISGFEEMWPSRWSAESSRRRSRSWKTVSVGLWPGRWCTWSVRSRRASSSPSWSTRVTSARAPQARNAADTGAQRAHHVRRDAVAEHHRAREVVVLLRLLGVVLHERHGHVDGRDVGARALRDQRHQPQVVDVLVGEDHQLDVLERVAQLGHAVRELVEGGGGVRAGVDERERLVLDQVDVDPPDRERCRDLDPVDPVGRAAGHERIRSSTSSRFSSMCSRETTRLEVQPQERLGVGGTHVEVPVVVVDGDPVEL